MEWNNLVLIIIDHSNDHDYSRDAGCWIIIVTTDQCGGINKQCQCYLLSKQQTTTNQTLELDQQKRMQTLRAQVILFHLCGLFEDVSSD